MQLLRKLKECHGSLLHLKAATSLKEESRKEEVLEVETGAAVWL